MLLVAVLGTAGMLALSLFADGQPYRDTALNVLLLLVVLPAAIAAALPRRRPGIGGATQRD